MVATRRCGLLLLALVGSESYQLGAVSRPNAPALCNRCAEVHMMGRKFEVHLARQQPCPCSHCGSVLSPLFRHCTQNNKLKMAKTALANAKKSSYIGKKVVIAVKAGGDDPSINRQLAAVMREANAMAK